MENHFDSIIKSDEPKHDKLAQILKLIIDQCHINPNSYFILGSYALREHREINDLDVNMNSSEFDKLEKCVKFGKVEPYNNQIRWFFDLTSKYKEFADPNAVDFSIEIFKKTSSEGFPNNNFSLQVLKDNGGLSEDKYGNPFFSLKTLLRWKQTMNREKDQTDIQMIETILRQQQGGYHKKYLKYKSKYFRLKHGQMPKKSIFADSS